MASSVEDPDVKKGRPRSGAPTIRVKICCIASIDEAWMAIEHGASAIGLVSAMPSGPGPIPEELIVKIANVVPPGVASFLLTCKQDVASISSDV